MTPTEIMYLNLCQIACLVNIACCSTLFRDTPIAYAHNFIFYAMQHCSKFLTIMLKLYSIFIPQFPYFANKLLLFWVNGKYLKNPCLVEKERSIYPNRTVSSIQLMTVLLEYINLSAIYKFISKHL